VPVNYEKDFVRAFLTFKLQVVYCPTQKNCVRLTNFDPNTYVSDMKEGELSNTVNWK
jgi:hypothetical protein